MVGIVIYVGTESKYAINQTKPRVKYSKFDTELDIIFGMTFIFMSLLSLGIMFISKLTGLKSYLVFGRCLLMFCSVIPVALRISLDIAKLVFSAFITRDKNICNYHLFLTKSNIL